jgi:hypothetical protein
MTDDQEVELLGLLRELLGEMRLLRAALAPPPPVVTTYPQPPVTWQWTQPSPNTTPWITYSAGSSGGTINGTWSGQGGGDAGTAGVSSKLTVLPGSGSGSAAVEPPTSSSRDEAIEEWLEESLRQHRSRPA